MAKLPASTLFSSEVNPVLHREIRARWRNYQSFLIVFGYAIALSILAYLKYHEVVETRHYGISFLDLRRTSGAGRTLFLEFNQWQMAGWLILAPLLTAGAIAGERERGLLENLLLSPLTKQQIIYGKWFSALALVALLLLVPLPVAALCFQLGGLSPQEFASASLFQATTAILGATVGLYVSAKAPRLNEALAKALVNTWWWGWVGPMVVLPAYFSFDSNDVVTLSFAVCFELTATILLLKSAVVMLAQPQEEMRPEIARTWMDAADKPRPMVLDIGLGEPQVVTANDLYGKGLALDDPERYKRWDMPGAERLRFENPVLQREVRTHLRLRAQHVGAKPGGNAGCSLMFVGLTFGIYFLAMLSDSELHVFFWGFFSLLWVLATAAVGAVLGSSAFTRERAAGMLEFLMLTCLTPREILWGKVSGALVVVLYYSLALIPPLAPCLLPDFNGQSGISGGHVIGTLLLVLSTAWASASWGALVSWLSRQNFVAVAVSLLGVLCFPYIPIVQILNPLAAQSRLQPYDFFANGLWREMPPWTFGDVLFVPVGLFLLGLLFFAVTLSLMKRDRRFDRK